ncbi:hypothetical protein EV122DRAFT_278424 [Schizophyllum commune]
MSRRYRLLRGQAVNAVKPVNFMFSIVVYSADDNQQVRLYNMVRDAGQDLGDGAYMREDKLNQIMSSWESDAIDWSPIYVAPDDQIRDEPEESLGPSPVQLVEVGVEHGVQPPGYDSPVDIVLYTLPSLETGTSASATDGNSSTRRMEVSTKARQAESSSRRKKDGCKILHRCPYFPACKTMCTRKFTLKGHVQSHENRREFVCDHAGCGERFNTPRLLQQHRDHVRH